MFFQGTLQEGIAKALQESRFVVCFVTDGQGESKQWEDDFLAQESVSRLLAAQAVCLRLEAASQEAGFLAQIYPIPKNPTLVMIKNGDLKEYLNAGASKEDFTSRVRKVLEPMAAAPQPQTQPEPAPTPSPAPEMPVAVPAAVPAAATSVPNPSVASNSTRQTPQQLTQAERIRKLLAERAERIEGERKKEAEEVERRAEEERVEKVKAKAAAVIAAKKPKRPPPEGVDLHVRLLDGSTIRNHFASSDTLRSTVRPWVDHAIRAGGSGAAAYTFKMVRIPPPALAIDVTQEDKPLAEVGLWPSATLILYPVARATSALGPGEGGNVLTRFYYFIMATITAMFGFVASFFTSLFRSPCPPPAPTEDASARVSGLDARRVKGTQGAARERRNDQQFYNGNSTNFEPRRDDVEEQ